jgi:hypothetical protein
MHQPLDMLGTQRAETVDNAFPAFVSLRRAALSLDHPAWLGVDLVCIAAVSGLPVAWKNAPARQKRLHSTYSLYVQPEVLNHVLNIPYAIYVFL